MNLTELQKMESISDCTLINAECLQAMDILIEKGIKIDAIITDPPYWTTACKWDSVIPFEEMWERLNKLIKPSWAIVLFWSEPFSSALRMSNIKNYKYDWIWETHKGKNPFLAKKQPLKKHETISIFNAKNVYNPQMSKWKAYKKRWEHNKIKEHNIYAPNKPVWYAKDFDSSKRYPTSVLQFSNHNQKENSFHPTQKPVALMEYLIKTYSHENELVLDFTMWSWTTGLASKNLNRKFIGIELDENYFNIAKNRISWEKNLFNN